MEELNQREKHFIITKLVFALLLVAFVSYFTGFNPIPANNTFAFILFLAVALSFEVSSFMFLFFGSANPAFAVYFSILILFGPGPALTAVLIGSFFRVAVLNYPNFLLKCADFSDSVIIISLTCLVYHMINGQNLFLSPLNIAALAALAFMYFLLDYLLPAVFIGIHFPENQKIWNNCKSKTNLINLAVMPCAIAISLLYSQNIFLALLALPILLVMRYMYGLSIYSGKIKLQEFSENEIISLKSKVQDIKDANVNLNADLQKKVDELSIFFELGHVLGANLALKSVLENIIYMIRRLVFCQSCVIFLYNKEGELLPYKYSTPFKEVLEASDLLKLSEPAVAAVVDTKKPILLSEFKAGQDRIFKDENSAMGVPLIIQNEPIGVIYIGDKNLNSFTNDHLQSVTHLANASAIAIKSALLFEGQEEALDIQQKINKQLDSRINEISIISDFGKALGNTLHVKETLNIVADSSKTMLNYQTCVIFLLEGEGKTARFVPKHIVSPHEGQIKDLKADTGDGLLGWVFKNRKVLLLEDAKESVMDMLIPNEQSIMAAPLIAENQIIGAIYFGAAFPCTFNDEMLSFVESVSYQAAMAIKNAEFYERIEKLAITDGLTGLYTHRYFQERLEESIKWSERYKKPISLLFIDLDHFKQFNDTHGHPEGDKILTGVASILRSYTREPDLVCRYGGDEFAIVLMDTSKEEALVIAERIRAGFVSVLKKDPVQITGSIGVSTYPDDAKTKVDLVLKADVATYKSKHEGKNKVSVA